MGGIKGNVGQDVSDMFDELSGATPEGEFGVQVEGARATAPAPLHDESLQYERPSFLNGQPPVSEEPTNFAGKFRAPKPPAAGMVHTHNKARGNKENNGTNWRADLIHNAPDDRRELDEIFKDPGKGGVRR